MEERQPGARPCSLERTSADRQLVEDQEQTPGVLARIAHDLLKRWGSAADRQARHLDVGARAEPRRDAVHSWEASHEVGCQCGAHRVDGLHSFDAAGYHGPTSSEAFRLDESGKGRLAVSALSGEDGTAAAPH